MNTNYRFIIYIYNIWFICLNNPRYAVGNKKLSDAENCKNFKLKDLDFSLNYERRFQDFLLKNYRKN